MQNQEDDLLLEAASELAYAAIEEVDDDLMQLQNPLRTVYAVYHATAILDAGGFLYFFDSDFPKLPPYSVFVEAYRTIGCEDQADSLQHAIDSFPFPSPEQKVQLRQEFMESHYDQSTKQVTVWNDKISGNLEVWQKLAAWIRQQPDFKQLG